MELGIIRYYFFRWTSGDVSFFDTERGRREDDLKTTFTMPESDVEINANYERIIFKTSIEDQVYTGNAITSSEGRIELNGTDLVVYDEMYTCKYENNVNAGKATIVVTLKGMPFDPKLGIGETYINNYRMLINCVIFVLKRRGVCYNRGAERGHVRS
ncbi:MAG: hypothetical protein IKE52_02725 [Mogibacterium sp.]|nr:hypothetical protein [Mogibacterium sp.]